MQKSISKRGWTLWLYWACKSRDTWYIIPYLHITYDSYWKGIAVGIGWLNRWAAIEINKDRLPF